MSWRKKRGQGGRGGDTGTDAETNVNKQVDDQVDGRDAQKVMESGKGGTQKGRPTPRPVFARHGGEKVINHENSWIVMTQDRWASSKSGYGGQGRADASAIDIVTGRMAWDPDPCTVVDPNFKSDAARVYISQMADIDRYFHLDVNDRANLKGGVSNSKARSCVGIKADAVRLVGREGVKIVTRTEGKNSLKNPIRSIPGIELIAGNDAQALQPIVKADDACIALQELADLIMDLGNSLKNTQEALITLCVAYGSHIHFTGPVPTTPGVSTVPIPGPSPPMTPPAPIFDSPSVAAKLIGDVGGAMIINEIACKNLGFAWRTTFTKAMGARYIGSRHNSTN
jgi:hypothetical protein